jgi:Mrp family chromosome partitioning ATPase
MTPQDALADVITPTFEDTIVFSRSRSVPVSRELIEQSRVLGPGGTGPAGQAFKMLRTQVLQRLKQRGLNALAVVSPTADDGKTFTAINLAIAIAGHEGHTALLVDMDLRRPSIHRRFGFEAELGIEQCLRGQCAIPDALVHPEGYERLLVLPASGPVELSSELIVAARARRLVAEIKARYPNRIILYDLPPVLDADDALAFLPQVDAALVVIAEERTRRDDVTRCFELLAETPVVGTVLNAVRGRAGSRYPY